MPHWLPSTLCLLRRHKRWGQRRWTKCSLKLIDFLCSFYVHTSTFDCQALVEVPVSSSYFKKDPAIG